MKYARQEFERKFLLETCPPDLPTTYRLIEDRYWVNTTLRLRRVSDAAGAVLSRKLNQKTRDDAGNLWITSTYLTEPEYRLLEVIPAATLRKRRYTLTANMRQVAIDVITLTDRELILAEIEGHSADEIAGNIGISVNASEVSNDPAFEGYQLALAAAACA